MKIGAAILALCVGAASVAAAEADMSAANNQDLMRCRPPSGYTSVHHRSELPKALSEEFGNTAMPGERWDAGDDLGGPFPHSGFQFVWSNGRWWIVAIGMGNVAPSFSVEAYMIDAEGSIVERFTVPEDTEDLCKAARKNAQQER